MAASRRPTKRKGDETRAWAPLAWMGWSLRMPPDWRPLQIEGGWDRGRVVIGDASAAIMQFRWWRPLEAAGPFRRVIRRRRRFDAAAWIAKRLRRVTGTSVGAAGAPQPAGFEEVAWIPPGAAGTTTLSARPGTGDESPACRADRSHGRRAWRRTGGLWYGYAPREDLVIEVLVGSAVSAHDRKDVARRVLPSLRAADLDGEMRVSLFGASFTAPAGFRPVAWHLHLGDIALRLRCRSEPLRGVLVLRQVYPAELALSRRSLVRWQEANPFPERRKYRPAAGSGDESEPCVVTVAGRGIPGVRRKGLKRLPVPLGWMKPLESVSIAVQDTSVGRLLIAEYDSAGAASSKLMEDVVVGAIRAMNWAMGEDPEHV